MGHRDWKRAYWAIFAGEFLAIAGFAVAIPVIPFFLESIGVTDQVSLNFWTGAIQSASAISLMVFAPVWGALGDSFGRKLMLLRAMFAGAVFVGIMSFSAAPWQILVMRTIQGAFTGTVTAANVLTACIVPEKRVGFFLGLTHTAVFLGNTLGPMAGGFINDAFGPRAAFVAAALFLAAAGVIILVFTYEVKPDAGSPQFRFRDCLPDFSILGKDKSLGALMAVMVSVQLAGSIAGPIIPLYVRSMIGTSSGAGSISGSIIGVTALASALAAALIGLISTKAGYGKTLFFCLACSSLVTLPQAFAGTPFNLLVMRGLSGFFLGGTLPTMNALIASRSPKEKRGAVFGLNSSISSAGMALGPAFGAVIASVSSYGSVFLVMAVLLALTAVGIVCGPRNLLRDR